MNTSKPTHSLLLYGPNGYRKFVDRFERARFKRSAQELTETADQAFCLTVLYTGCRISEALELTVDRIDFANGCVVFETLKQRQKGIYRAVPVPRSLLYLYRSLIPEGSRLQKGSNRLFGFGRTTGYKRIKDCMASAGVVGRQANARGLRHGFGVCLRDHDFHLWEIQGLLGHKDVRNTTIYLQFIGQDLHKKMSSTWEDAA